MADTRAKSSKNSSNVKSVAPRSPTLGYILHHRKKARYVCMSSILTFLCFKRLTIDT